MRTISERSGSVVLPLYGTVVSIDGTSARLTDVTMYLDDGSKMPLYGDFVVDADDEHIVDITAPGGS
jgi:hypothetical protein